MKPHSAQSTGQTKAVARNFSNAVTLYDREATVQRETAKRLIASLRPWSPALPPGPVLEIGCGTGFVTAGLMDLFPNRELEITDISPEMVQYTAKKFKDAGNARFRTLDAEQFKAEKPHYALTISGFAAQWFRQPALTLGQFLEATQPGGLLLACFPGNETFPEWKKMCEELGIPFTRNPLPDTEEMVVKLSTGPAQVDYYEDTVTQKFSSAADFFQHLKSIGAATQNSGRHLTSKELKLLVDHWDRQTGGQCTVSYHIVFMAVKRDYNS